MTSLSEITSWHHTTKYLCITLCNITQWNYTMTSNNGITYLHHIVTSHYDITMWHYIVTQHSDLKQMTSQCDTRGDITPWHPCCDNIWRQCDITQWYHTVPSHNDIKQLHHTVLITIDCDSYHIVMAITNPHSCQRLCQLPQNRRVFTDRNTYYILW